MDEPFFIMIHGSTGNSSVIPMIDIDGEMLMFPTEKHAREVAEGHHACKILGYEIFEVGSKRGCSYWDRENQECTD